MQKAIEEAKKAFSNGEVPIGAVAVLNDNIIASAHNEVIRRNDPTAHAEILILREAGKILNNYRLNELCIYATVEPCPMCISAMLNARIEKLFFGTKSEKWGFMTRFNLDISLWNHKMIVYDNIASDIAASLIVDFFKERRIP